MDFIYPLSNDTWDQEELKQIDKVIKSGRFSMGKTVQEYEKKFAEKFGIKYAVMSNSGSSANLLAVASLVFAGHLKAGDEVLVTAVSWSTTYFPLAQYGLKIRFVDIDRDTLNIDTTKLQDAVTDKTKALFAVNLLGNPNDFDELKSFCERNELILFEDNCESMGAVYGGRKAGTIGVVGSFSSFYSHHICTMEGGMTVTDDEVVYNYMLALRAHGWTRNLPEKNAIHEKSGDAFYESFNFLVPGYNLRPLEMEAAIGLSQIDKLDGIIKTRRENAAYLKEVFGGGSQDISIQKEIGDSSWYGFAFVLQGDWAGKRSEIIQCMNEAKIEVRPIVAGNFTKQKAVKYMDYSVSGDLVNSDYIHDNGFLWGIFLWG